MRLSQTKEAEAFWTKSTIAGAKAQSGNKRLYSAMAEVEWKWITRSLTFLNCKVWGGVCQERRLERELESMLLRTWKAMPGSLAIIISKGCHRGVIIKGGHNPNCILDIAFCLLFRGKSSEGQDLTTQHGCSRKPVECHCNSPGTTAKPRLREKISRKLVNSYGGERVGRGS